MKGLITIIALCITTGLFAQNVGINTNTPQENLHIRTDSMEVKTRLDSKRSTNGFVFQSSILQVNGVNQLNSFACSGGTTLTCITWNNLTVAALAEEDDQVAITSDSLAPFNLFSGGLTNEIEVQFQTSSIPNDAIVSGISILIEYDTGPTDQGMNFGLIGFNLGALGGVTFINEYYRILDASDNEIIQYPTFIMTEGEDQVFILNEELQNPTAISNLGNLKLIIPSLMHINPFLVGIGIDKVALKVDYYVPVTGETNSTWKYGVVDGSYTVESPNETVFSIKENGVTLINELRIPTGASTGHILTSNSKGKAFWKALPSDNDLDWRIQEDTLQNLPIPTKSNSKMYMSQGAKLGSNNALPEAGDIRFDSATGSFEGYTGAKWIPFSINSGWGSLKGEEQQSFEKTAPKFKTFGKSVGLRGDNAMAVSDSSIVFFEYDENTDSWSELSEFLFTAKASEAELFNEYAAVAFENNLTVFHKVNGNWTIEFSYLIPFKVNGYKLTMGSESRLAYGIDQEIIIMERSGTNWSPVDTLETSFLSISGDDLELKGNNLVFGDSGNNSGKAYHAILENGDWKWKDTLSSPINPNNYDDDFGIAVSIGGSRMAIGARSSIGDPEVGGRVYLYKFNVNQNKYELESIAVSPNGPDSNFFGHSVDISPSSDYLVISDYLAEKIYVFERNNEDWNHTTTLTSSGDISDNRFADDVQITNNHLVAGIPVISGSVNDKPGKVHFYKNE